MNHFYVYALLDPRKDFQPFYIGKGKDERVLAHFRESELEHGRNPVKQNTIKAIKKSGLDVKILFMAGDLTEEEAFSLETALIKQYGRLGFDENGILTNILVDPNPTRTGVLHTDETKAKMRESHKDRVMSEEHKRNISKALKGHVVTAEQKDKQRKAMQGRSMSEEQKEIRRIKQTGKKRGPYTFKESAEERSARAKLNGAKGGRPKKVT